MRRARALAGMLTLIVVATLLQPRLAAAVSAPQLNRLPAQTQAGTSTGTPKPADTTRPDRVSAQLLARQTGRQVEVTDLRSETSLTFANPDGTFTSDIAAAPVRVKTPSGWQDIDTTLVSDQTGVHPKVARATVRFSVGGTGEAASLTANSKTLGFSWPAALPTPTLDGAVATYKDVLPGADLQLEAMPAGYAQRLVLRTRPSSAPVIRLPLRLAGLTAEVTASGRITLTDPAGKLLVEADPPRMWGAERDPNSNEPTKVAPVAVRITGGLGSQVLEIAPDAGFLADPVVSYPVTIDPSPNLAATADTFIDSGFPTSSYNTDPELKSGTYNGGTNKLRSLLKFDSGPISGTHVLAATLSLYEAWSWSCSARQVNILRATSNWSGSVTWNTRPSTNGFVQASANVAKGHDSGCPAGWVSFDLQGLAQAWADGSVPNYGFYVQAASETDNYGWKKFLSYNTSTGEPRLQVTYNSYPATPGSSMSPANGAFVPTTTPTMKANFKDNDGGTGRVDFQVYDDTSGTLVASGNGTNVHSVALSQWTVPRDKLVNGTRYRWRCRAYDGTDFGSWSAYKTFTVDTTAPAAPSVSSPDYPAGQWSTSPLMLGRFFFSDSSTDVAGYYYGLDKTPPPTYTTGDNVSLFLADGYHRLYVQAADQAGNRSAITEYAFGVGAGGIETPRPVTAPSAASRSRPPASPR